MDRAYDHDPVGNITNIVNNLNSSRSKTFGYDDLDQLISSSSDSYPSGDIGFTYSGNGNRLTKTAGIDVTTYGYTDNRLTSLSGAETGTYDYDDLGNLTSSVIGGVPRSYEYDHAGRLISIDQGSTARYYYDTRSRRVKSTVGGSGKLFLYGSAGQLINEMTTTGKWVADYVYLNGRPLAKIAPVPKVPPGTTSKSLLEAGTPPAKEMIYYYHLDHLGTPLAMTDANKVVQWSSEYYPFGGLYDETVVQSNEFRFPGQYHDRETDLYYNWHRYYDPTTGRYVSADRFWEMSPGLAPYAYVANSPLRYTDPSGDSIFIYIDDKEINYYNRPYDFSGLTEGERALLTDIMVLRLTREGAALFNELANNKFHNRINVNRYYINRITAWFKEGACNPDIGSAGDIYYNWVDWDGGENEDGTRDRPPYLALFHELVHMLHYNRGSRDPIDDQIPTIIHENKLRRELRDEYEMWWIKLRKAS